MKINTNIDNKSPSFKGLYNNKALKKGLEFAADNGALFSSTVSLGLSTMVRPIAIFSAPNVNKEDKKYACAKSLASSTTGFLLMLAVTTPLSKAIKKINKSPIKYLSQKTIKNLYEKHNDVKKSDTYKCATQLFKLGAGFFMAAPKSIMTCALVPQIIAVGNNNKELINPKTNYANQISFNSARTENLAKNIGRIIDNDKFQDVSKNLSKTNFEQHIISLTDILSTLTFIKQTNNNKKIDDDRKKTLAANSAISTSLSVLGGYLINHVLKKPTDKFIKKFSEINKNSPKLDKYIEGIKIAKPVCILGCIYYILIPFISTILADKTCKMNSHKQ